MDLAVAVAKSEQALISGLEERQAGIDDVTGKGLATERLIDDRLIRPYLPPGFRSVKGEVVNARDPGAASPPIDRIIYSERVCPPLIYDEAHSVVPFECTAGVVEITMRLDATKLRTDIARTRLVRALRHRRYMVSVPGSSNLVHQVEAEATMGCRAYVIGLPADRNWRPESIVDALRRAQAEDGGTLVHALYVLGIGVFETLESKIRAWLGPDRMYRFVTGFRNSFDRWPELPKGTSADLGHYVAGEPRNFG